MMILLKEIESYFIQQINSSLENTIGLFDGDTGMAIILFMLNGSEKNGVYERSALNLLGRVNAKIGDFENLDFAFGLAGIGWGIEWMSQNGFLDINTDIVLEDLDDILYRSVVYSIEETISLAKGVLGKFLYFWYRYKSKNPHKNRLKNIFHEECLVLLTDDLYEKVCGENGIIKKNVLSAQDLIDIGHVIFFLSDFLSLKINAPTVESTLYETIHFIDNYLEHNNTMPQDDNYDTSLFLASCYYLAGKNHRHNYWKTKARIFIKEFQLYKRSDSDSLLRIVNIGLYSMFKMGNLLLEEGVEEIEHVSLGSIYGKICLICLANNGVCDFEMGILLIMMFFDHEVLETPIMISE